MIHSFQFKQRVRNFICAAFFFAGCAVSAQSVRYAITPENPLPGEPVTIAVNAHDARGVKSAALYAAGGERLARALFFTLPDEAKEIAAAVLTVPSTAAPGFAHINLENETGAALEIPLVIRDREFIDEVIPLDENLTGIRTVPDPQKTAEARQLWEILGATGSEVYCTGNFTPPVTATRRTSFFGDRRTFRYSTGRSDTAIHAGIDYGVPTGTRVSACAPGKVVLARSRIVTGNSVVIEHLPGVYSLYYHLDSIEISEGALVSAGTPLGLSGATGLATGPHLHWEIRVSGENTDPDAFIGRPVFDREKLDSLR